MGDSKTSEVIDLSNPKSKCKPWPTLNTKMATGQLIGNNFIVCGGYPKATSKNCYKISPTKIESIPGLQFPSSAGTSAVIDNSLFVASGNDYISKTEYISEKANQMGPNLPGDRNLACMIQMGKDKVMLTGGSSSRDYFKSTHIFDRTIGKWESGPSMIEYHVGHGCGAFQLGNNLVCVVAGRFRFGKVEFLMPCNDPNAKWVQGMS